MKSDHRAKKISKIIRKVWSSLESHLDWTWGDRKKVKGLGTRNFDRKCVKEYAEIIKDLADLYD